MTYILNMRMNGRKWIRRTVCLMTFAGVASQLPYPRDAVSQEPGTVRPASLMRAKLTPTKEILEGIALNDFDMIGKNAGAIRNLLLDERWMVVQSDEYRRQTEDFRKLVEELRQAASDKNIDRATLAYVQMTFQCVRCHKTLRTPEVKPSLPVQP